MSTRSAPPHSRAAAFLFRRAPGPALAAGLGVAVLVGAGDWLTGPELSLAVFYIVAVAVASWWGGRRQGLVVALLSAVLWLVCDQLSHTYSHPAVGYWNGTVRLATWSCFSLLLAAVRTSAERERERRLSGGGLRPEGRAEAFYVAVDQEFAALRNGGPAFTLVYVETTGLEGSDADDGSAQEALIATLRATMRRSDRIAAPRGREVALLLAETTPQSAAVALSRITAALRGFMEQKGRAQASAAVGAVTCTAALADVNAVLQRAYQQMYYGPRTPGAVSLTHETLPPVEVVADVATAPA